MHSVKLIIMINSAPFHIDYYQITTCELCHKFTSLSIDDGLVVGGA
jgi:hypothetical protein